MNKAGNDTVSTLQLARFRQEEYINEVKRKKQTYPTFFKSGL